MEKEQHSEHRLCRARSIFFRGLEINYCFDRQRNGYQLIFPREDPSTEMSDRSLGASTAGRHCSEAESPKREHVALAPIHSFPRRGLPRSPAQIRPASHVPIAGRLAATRQERISRGSRRPTGDASFHPVRDDDTKRGTPHAHRRRHPRTADTDRGSERERARLGKLLEAKAKA